MKSAKIMTVVAALAVVSASAFATTVGYVSPTIGEGFSIFSAPFKTTPTSFTGKVSGTLDTVSGLTVTDADAGWSAGFATAGAPYAIRITRASDDAIVNFIISGDSLGTTLTLAAPAGSAGYTLDGDGFSAGDVYEIIVPYTLGTLFANSNILSGPNQASSDTVLFFTGAAWSQVHLNSVSGNWQQGASATDLTDTVILPNLPIVINRTVGQGNLTLVSAGVVEDGTNGVTLVNGVTFVANLYPTDTTIDEFALETSTGWINVNGSTPFSSADQILFFTGAAWTTVVFDETVGASGEWVTAGTSTIVGSTSVPAGSGFAVVKQSATTTYKQPKNF
jgi:hypothetical protein